MDLAYGGIRPLQLPGAAWQKSSYSNPSGNCVEMARLSAGQVAVRDSKRPGDPVLVFTRTEWSAFLSALRTAPACLPAPRAGFRAHPDRCSGTRLARFLRPPGQVPAPT